MNPSSLRYSKPAHSALFKIVKNLIVTSENYSFRVSTVFNDKNDDNLRIYNEDRLKKILFDKILHAYNLRIEKKQLNYNKLSSGDLDNLEILKYKFADQRDVNQYSGKYVLYPRTFLCKKCGDYRNLKTVQELNIFNPKKCMIPSCDGEYEQLEILLYCEDCGIIKPLTYSCGDHPIKLQWGKKDSLSTWKAVCDTCWKQGRVNPIDIFRFECSHEDFGEKICNKDNTKFSALTVREGGVSNPVVITIVDIPETNFIDVDNLKYIVLGLYLNKFSILVEKGYPVSLDDINRYFNYYNNKKDDPMVDRQKLEYYIDKVIAISSNLKSEYIDVDLESFNDYYSVKGIFSDDKQESKMKESSFESFIESQTDLTKKEMLKRNFEDLKQEFGIEDVTYISNINLISSVIGIINGINKFYEKDFVPHFTPIWKDFRVKKEFYVYSYPFETEGIMIDLNKIKVCEWLIKNKFLHTKIPNSTEEAIELLLKIKKEEKAYQQLQILLHTLSHILIRRSPLHTGLDSESCSELIFVNSAAILIYSTSIINTGGFSFVFEHSLFDWFGDVKLELNDCTLDPTCIFENGACFSCMYVPEFVCSDFNRNLDRDVFLGKKRYEFSYW